MGHLSKSKLNGQCPIQNDILPATKLVNSNNKKYEKQNKTFYGKRGA